MKSKGRLTDNAITPLNVHYVVAIRNNKDDIDGCRALVFSEVLAIVARQ